MSEQLSMRSAAGLTRAELVEWDYFDLEGAPGSLESTGLQLEYDLQ